MYETLKDYDEFSRKVDHKRPIHFQVDRKYTDKFRSAERISIVLTGMCKENGWILRWVASAEVDEPTDSKAAGCVEKLLDDYALPLKATEGYYE